MTSVRAIRLTMTATTTTTLSWVFLLPTAAKMMTSSEGSARLVMILRPQPGPGSLPQPRPGLSLAHGTTGHRLTGEPEHQASRVRHVGAYPELEDELCDFGPEGLSAGRSPDRLDALVWALTHLALGPPARPRVRVL